mgnify:CR=1 FL=1|jgi:hypothetical protein
MLHVFLGNSSDGLVCKATFVKRLRFTDKRGRRCSMRGDAPFLVVVAVLAAAAPVGSFRSPTLSWKSTGSGAPAYSELRSSRGFSLSGIPCSPQRRWREPRPAEALFRPSTGTTSLRQTNMHGAGELFAPVEVLDAVDNSTLLFRVVPAEAAVGAQIPRICSTRHPPYVYLIICFTAGEFWRGKREGSGPAAWIWVLKLVP